MGRSLLLFFVASVVCSIAGCDRATNEPELPQESYLNIRAAWSPDGGTIAFTSQVSGKIGIWLVDTNGNNLRQLHAGDAVGATWSPDNRWVAFSQANQILARNVVNDSLKTLVQQAVSIQPAWSPGGDSLVFQRVVPEGSLLTVMDLRDSTEIDLLHTGESPAWIHGNSEVFYATVEGLTSSASYRYRFNALDVSSLIVLPLFSIDRQVPCRWFRLDNIHAVFTYEVDDPFARRQIDIYEPLAGTNTRATTDGGADPAISPDGSRIVYTSTAPEEGGLWIMRADGTGKRRLTSP